MKNELLNIENVKQGDEPGQKSKRLSRVASAKERNSSHSMRRPISAVPSSKKKNENNTTSTKRDSSRNNDDGSNIRSTPYQSDVKAADDITEEDSISSDDSKSEENDIEIDD